MLRGGRRVPRATREACVCSGSSAYPRGGCDGIPVAAAEKVEAAGVVGGEAAFEGVLGAVALRRVVSEVQVGKRSAVLGRVGNGREAPMASCVQEVTALAASAPRATYR